MAFVIAFVGAMLPCYAQEEKQSEEEAGRRYIGLVSWFPQDSDIWDFAYAVRYLGVKKEIYVTGVIGNAEPEAVGIMRGSELKAVSSRLFAGVGAGVNLTKSANKKTFVGVGATLYWVESDQGGEGWVYVDELLRPLGPAHDESLFLSPEITAHFQVGKNVGLYLCANLGSEGLPPKQGLYVGVSFHK
jgi:hypothetical protein